MIIFAINDKSLKIPQKSYAINSQITASLIFFAPFFGEVFIALNRTIFNSKFY